MQFLGVRIPEAFAPAVRSCRQHILMAAGFSALINILYLAPTIYMMQVYDRVVPTNGLATLYWLTVIVGVAIAVLATLDALRTRLMLRASLRLDRHLAPIILEQSMARQDAGSGVIVTGAMRQFDILRQAMAGPAILALFDIPWAPLYVIVAFMIHPFLGGLVVVAAAVLVLLARANQIRMREVADQAHDATSAAYLVQDATVREAEMVRALGMRKAMVSRHVEGRRKGFASTLDLQMTSSRYNSLIKFVRMFMQSVALGAGALLAVKGEISVGAIIAASVLLSRALQPVEQMVGSWSTIVQAKQALRSLDALLGDKGAVEPARTVLPDPKGHISVDRVIVRSDDQTAVILKQVSVDIEPGQVLGVVGPSGAGKSTLVRVIAGALRPDAGDVRFDGAQIEQWDPERRSAQPGDHGSQDEWCDDRHRRSSLVCLAGGRSAAGAGRRCRGQVRAAIAGSRRACETVVTSQRRTHAREGVIHVVEKGKTSRRRRKS
jgi:ABC-type protease/lipase transport system fused ATPase/permease subunit